MAVLAQRVIAGLVALLGLLMTGGGLWLATQLGPRGAATFTTTPDRAGAVLVTPNVLNRLDGDVVIKATGAKSEDTVWLGLASPSDADLIVGSSPATRLTGFSVRDGWVLRSAASGTGDSPAFAGADIWRDTASGKAEQALTVSQKTAPESIVISAESGRVGKVSMTVEHKAWFVQALITAVVGLALMVAGLLLWRLHITAVPAWLGTRTGRSSRSSEKPAVMSLKARSPRTSPPAVPTPTESEVAPLKPESEMAPLEPPPAAEAHESKEALSSKGEQGRKDPR